MTTIPDGLLDPDETVEVAVDGLIGRSNHLLTTPVLTYLFGVTHFSPRPFRKAVVFALTDQRVLVAGGKGTENVLFTSDRSRIAVRCTPGRLWTRIAIAGDRANAILHVHRNWNDEIKQLCAALSGQQEDAT